MAAEKTRSDRKGSEGAEGEYVQVFLYRVPKSNREAFAGGQRELAELFRKHGIVRSEFFVLRDARTFAHFRDLRTVLDAASDEEVWMEVETYRDAADSVRVI